MRTTTPMHRTRTALALLALALLALALLAGAPGSAQDLPAPGEGFTWERVGDRPIQPYDLTLGPDSSLWAAADDGPHRLDLTGGFPGVWEWVSEFPINRSLLVLGRGPEGDTLVSGTFGSTRRTTDGGATWEIVHHRGDEGLFEVPAGLPWAGRLLVGAGDGFARSIAYSDDRGATWTEAEVEDDGEGNYGSARDVAALPPGSPWAGRLLAAGDWGVNVSDDGGQTWRKSGLWRVLYYYGNTVAVAEHPAGTAVVGGDVNARAYARAWSSADGGQTWGPTDGNELPEGPPNGGWMVEAMVPLGGASVLAVLVLGTVYRSDDAGATWAAVGRAPIDVGRFVRSALLGPDRRLYVAISISGLEEGWVWRTAERFAPAPVGVEEATEEESLGVEVAPNPSPGEAAVTVRLGEPSEVSAVLYDALGRRVAVLHEGPLGAGRHELALDGSELPPGVYVVHVRAGGEVATATVTLLR